MGKTLNELTDDLQEFILDERMDAHVGNRFDKYRYNNLKLALINPNDAPIPFLVVSIGISEVVFDLATRLRVSGSLGTDEKYVYRWLAKMSVMTNLQECYKEQIQQTVHEDDEEEESK